MLYFFFCLSSKKERIMKLRHIGAGLFTVLQALSVNVFITQGWGIRPNTVAVPKRWTVVTASDMYASNVQVKAPGQNLTSYLPELTSTSTHFQALQWWTSVCWRQKRQQKNVRYWAWWGSQKSCHSGQRLRVSPPPKEQFSINTPSGTPSKAMLTLE